MSDRSEGDSVTGEERTQPAYLPVSGPHLVVWVTTFAYTSTMAVVMPGAWRWVFLVLAVLTAPAVVVDVAKRLRRARRSVRVVPKIDSHGRM